MDFMRHAPCKSPGPNAEFVTDCARTMADLTGQVAVIMGRTKQEADTICHRAIAHGKSRLERTGGQPLDWKVMRDLTVDYMEMLLAELKRDKEAA